MAEDLPDSWEVADLDASMSRLMLSKPDSSSASTSPPPVDVSAGVVTADLVDSVDQFLREALQNPRERLSVLRLEQDVEKFIRDPTQQQMEFQQLPTSYLRLAAHRIAQHYSLQSMVLLDNTLPDGSGSRIIIRKTSECQPPLIRLADIPVTVPTEDTISSVVKVAIKQRPQKRSQNANNAGSHSSKANSSKSVEERKEDYNRARARIFSSSTSGGASGKPEIEARAQERFQHGLLGISKIEEATVPVGTDVNIGRGSVDSSAGSSRSNRSRIEEPVGRYRTNNRVAIFRDREVERHDPDYDRSYDRYAQRFDPGFGFNGGLYPVQPLYSPVVNYNSEFPQLGAGHRSPVPAEHPSRSLPQHLPGPWVAASSPAGSGYGPPETMMNPFSPNHNHVPPHSASTLYLNYPCQRPGMTFIHPLEQVYQPFPQSYHHQQSESSFGLARPR